MTVFNSEQRNQAIGKSLVIPTNEACIKGNDYTEIEPILNSIDFFDLISDTTLYAREIKLLRLFVKKLHKKLATRNSYVAPVVKGLLDIEDDYTFVSFVSLMKEGLWN